MKLIRDGLAILRQRKKDAETTAADLAKRLSEIQARREAIAKKIVDLVSDLPPAEAVNLCTALTACVRPFDPIPQGIKQHLIPPSTLG